MIIVLGGLIWEVHDEMICNKKRFSDNDILNAINRLNIPTGDKDTPISPIDLLDELGIKTLNSEDWRKKMKGVLNINVDLQDEKKGKSVTVEVRLFKWLIKRHKEHFYQL